MLNRALKQISILRLGRALQATRQLSTSAARSSGGAWNYRSAAPTDKSMAIAAEVFGGFMWWWILWHFWHEPGHVFGEFDYPKPAKWTDAELGIPADSDE